MLAGDKNNITINLPRNWRSVKYKASKIRILAAVSSLEPVRDDDLLSRQLRPYDRDQRNEQQNTRRERWASQLVPSRNLLGMEDLEGVIKTSTICRDPAVASLRHLVTFPPVLPIAETQCTHPKSITESPSISAQHGMWDVTLRQETRPVFDRLGR